MAERRVVDAIADKHVWWTISSEAIMDMLRRAHAGEDPAAIYAREYLSSDSEDSDG